LTFLIRRKNMNKRLKIMIGKITGRDNRGRVAVRHLGGGNKRYFRVIDFRRDKKGVVGTIKSVEDDPNRNVEIALVGYQDGDERYILAPQGIKIGDQVVAGDEVEIKIGNTLPLANIPVGTPIHNLELVPNSGGKIVRGAGTMAAILAKEGQTVQVKLPSGEIRLFLASCRATIGQIGNVDEKLKKLKKAGDIRRRGIRPTVRGVAQNPHSHPHGGGEGRSGIGMPGPKTPWGKPARGVKTRKKRKYSDKLIVKRRK